MIGRMEIMEKIRDGMERTTVRELAREMGVNEKWLKAIVESDAFKVFAARKEEEK